jgi:hypothetical protein
VLVTAAGTNAMWSWGPIGNQSSMQNNCSMPSIYDSVSSTSSPSVSWSINTTYTTRVSYNNATGAFRARQYRGGPGLAGLSGTLVSDVSATVAVRSTYWWAINADQDGGTTVFHTLNLRPWAGD